MHLYKVSIGVDYVKTEYFQHVLYAQDEEQLDAVVARMSTDDIVQRGREDGSTEGAYNDDNTRVADADIIKRVRRGLVGLPAACQNSACTKFGDVIAVAYFDSEGDQSLDAFVAEWRPGGDAGAACPECDGLVTLCNPTDGQPQHVACTCGHDVNAPDCKNPDCDGHDNSCAARQLNPNAPRDTHAQAL
jgi:hypothetical protein